MKRVGIITIVDNNNYGNRLQNLAVTEVFRRMGYHPETLVLNPRKGSSKYALRAARMVVTPLIKGVERLCREPSTAKRIRRFKAFNQDNGFVIRYLPVWTYRIRKKYAYFVVGSDQIWNPNMDYGYGTEFLAFADRNQRVCFSPSFGVKCIPNHKREQYIDGLNGIPYISVRENGGARLVNELTGKEAEVLIDPTMMLDAGEWEKIEKKPSFLPTNQKYMFEYFLGGCSEQTEAFLRQTAEREDLIRINPRDKYSEAYCIDPAEFLYLIHHANQITTDSFHACVFSALFGKPFSVWERIGQAGMGDRIVTLLGMLKAEQTAELPDGGRTFQTKRYTVQEILKCERQRVLAFLEKSMGR